MTNYPEGMEQLSSPTASARAFADWTLSSDFDNPEKPLGSVSLLLSEHEERTFTLPSGETVNVPTADAEHVDDALSDWFERANSHPDNLAVFFFSGHGLTSGADMALILSDYGCKQINPLKGAIDLKGVQLAMDTCKASNVVWFIDACRKHSKFLDGKGNIGVSPIMPDADRRIELSKPAESYVLYSALIDSAAYGREGQPSEFTNVLIKGLKQFGAVDNEGDWWVTTSGLAEILHNCVGMALWDKGLDQKIEVGRQSLFNLTKAKVDEDKITTYVTTKNRDFWEFVRLSCSTNIEEVHSINGRDLLVAQQPAWEIGLSPNQYHFQASWPLESGQEELKMKTWVVPPFKFVRL